MRFQILFIILLAVFLSVPSGCTTYHRCEPAPSCCEFTETGTQNIMACGCHDCGDGYISTEKDDYGNY